jgi:hypothetical protein
MNNIAVVFTSILSSGVVAAAISASFSEAKERWLLRRSKIEEIYLNGAAWLNYVNGRYLHYLRVCRGALTYKQLLDMQLDKAEKEGPNTRGDQMRTLTMNIEMYEHSLIPPLRLVEEELKKLNSVMFSIERSCKKNEDVSTFFHPFNDQLKAFGDAGDALITAVVKRGAEIGGEKGQIGQAYEWLSTTTKQYAQRFWLTIKRHS